MTSSLQAMAAYRTAARLFPGLHDPLLGMGCEYARMNSTALAQQLLRSAHAVCPQARPTAALSAASLSARQHDCSDHPTHLPRMQLFGLVLTKWCKHAIPLTVDLVATRLSMPASYNHPGPERMLMPPHSKSRGFLLNRR